MLCDNFKTLKTFYYIRLLIKNKQHGKNNKKTKETRRRWGQRSKLNNMTGLNKRKTLGYLLSVFIRIYTPFIIMSGVFIQGVSELLGVELTEAFYYGNSITTGASFTVVFYILATSRHLCRYHKYCSYMLLLVMIEGMLYYYIPSIGYGNYLLAFTITSFAGMVFFITFLVCRFFISRNRKR